MPSNTEIVRASVDALNAHDVAALKTFWHPDGVERFPDATCNGPEEIGAYFQDTFDAMPDLRVEIKAIAAEDDSVFMQHVITGTHTGVFKGIAPTGKQVEIPGIDHFTLRDGKFISNFVVFDQMEIGRALGLMPPDGSTADRAMKSAFNALTAARKRVAR